MTRVQIVVTPGEAFHLPGGHNQKSHGNRAGKKDNVPGKTSKHAPAGKSDSPNSRRKKTAPKKSTPKGPMTAEQFDARVADAARGIDVHDELVVNDSLETIEKMHADGKLGGLSVDDVAEAYLTYTDFNYMDINKALRRGNTGPLSSGEKKTISTLDEMMKLSPLKKDVVVMRGIKDPRAVFGDAYVRSDDPNANRGLTWIDGAFTSTTTEKKVADGFNAGVMMNILVPKGTLATGTPASQYPEESEIILPRGTKFRVVRSRRAATMVLDVEVVADDE